MLCIDSIWQCYAEEFTLDSRASIGAPEFVKFITIFISFDNVVFTGVFAFYILFPKSAQNEAVDFLLFAVCFASSQIIAFVDAINFVWLYPRKSSVAFSGYVKSLVLYALLLIVSIHHGLTMNGGVK